MARGRGRDGRRADGTAAEALAERALVDRGYRIVARNFRGRIGELDLVAYDGDVLVFVEVRSRRDYRFGGARLAVPHHKQRQVAAVARLFIAQRQPRFRTCRFDVVAVTGAHLEVIPGAFHITWS
ncbi:MAG: YraN family protein [Kofleriaceae bacterium]